jgi:hypothetical protein
MEMQDMELDFKGGNPGAVQYGNFINYYQFHPPENRLKLLPTGVWNKTKPFCALDLGCNAGVTTFNSILKLVPSNFFRISQLHFVIF